MLTRTSTGWFEWEFASNRIVWSDELGPILGLPRGFTPDEWGVVGERVLDPASAAAFRLASERARDGHSFELELRFRPEGSDDWRWLWIAAEVTTDHAGEPFALSGLVRDISARKQVQDEREAALVDARAARHRSEVLLATGTMMTAARDLTEIAAVVTDHAVRGLGGRDAHLHITDGATDRHFGAAAAGDDWLRLDLRVTGGTVGTLAVDAGVGLETDGPSSAWSALADQLAQATARALLAERQHRIAATLQHSLLPTSLPRPRWARLTARYRAAVADLDVGGDWYDAAWLGDRRLCIVVGDVVGRGLGAAANMGRMRSAFSALVDVAPDPAVLLTRFDRMANRLDGALGSTMAVVVADLETGRLDCATAGHPAPVLLGPEGRIIDVVPGPPLGTGTTRTSTTDSLPPGHTLLLYTDGLVERRGEPLTLGLSRLFDTASALPWTDPDVAVDELIDQVLPAGPIPDDVAVLALTRWSAPAERLLVRAPATSASLGPIRHDLREWLHATRLTDHRRFEIELAVGELAANAVEHAYGTDVGPVEVEAWAVDRAIHVVVHDEGRWRRTPARGERGRGLRIARQVADVFDLDRGGDGTTIHLTFDLPA